MLVRRLRPSAQLPRRMTAQAAGFDVHACLEEALVLEPGARAAVPTGLALAIPFGHEVQVRPRSGLAFKHGVTVLNAPGTIDADYRGEVKVLLVNLGAEAFSIRHGERVAQLVVARVSDLAFEACDVLPEPEPDPDPQVGHGTSIRGTGGFGSTGR